MTAPRSDLQWSLCINANNLTYAGNGSEDLQNGVVYTNIQNILIEKDTGVLHIPLVSSELLESTFNCTVFDFDNQPCGQSEPFLLEVFRDNRKFFVIAYMFIWS